MGQQVSVSIELSLAPETLALLRRLVRAVCDAAPENAGALPQPASLEGTEAAPRVSPAAPTPMPPPAPATPGGLRKWTQARLALLDELWPAGEPEDVVLARINQLPGSPFSSRRAIVDQAAQRGLTRRVEATAPAPRPPARADTLERISAAINAGPVTADFAAIAEWGGSRGIQCHTRADVPAVNAKRVQLGLPAFRLPERPVRP